MTKFTWDPNLHITKFTRDPNLHNIKFTRNPNLHKKFTQHQICTDPNLHKNQIYTGPKLTQTQFHTKATFTHERAYWNCTLVKNSEYCTEKMKPPKRDYFECLCSSMLEVTVNIPVENQYASISNHIWGHKRHIYFRNGTLTITLDEKAMQLVISEFSIALHTHLNLILSEIKITQWRCKILVVSTCNVVS